MVENEARAREVTDYRQRLTRDKARGQRAGQRGSLEQMMIAQAAERRLRNSRWSSRATCRARSKRSSRRSTSSAPTRSRAPHRSMSGAGAITESDVTLAEAVGRADHRLQRPRQRAGARPRRTRRHRDPLLLTIIYNLRG